MNTTESNEAPLIIRKRFQVVVEVEVKVAEMPRTPEETRLFGRIAYEGKEVQKMLDAENALLNETLNNPQSLRVWLGFHRELLLETPNLVLGEEKRFGS